MAFTYNPNTSKFKFVNNQILIKTNLNDTLSVDMFLDLGASSSIFFMDTGFLKLNVQQKIIPLPTMMTSAGGKKVHAKAACFGTITTPFFNITNSFILIQDRQNILPCDNFHGLWGADIFALGNFSKKGIKVLYISLQDTTLTVLDSLPDIQNWIRIESRFKGISSAFQVKMKVGSESLFFLFDTGYDGSIIMNQNDYNIVLQNSNAITDIKKTCGLINRTLAGNNYDTVVSFRSNIGVTDSLNFKSVPVNIMRSIDQNIIGMEFIKRFNIIVDYQGKNIYFQPNKNYKPENNTFFKVKGFTPTITSDHGFNVKAITVNSPAENAGLKVGDKIISINGVLSDSIDQCEIQNKFGAFDGSKANNTIVVQRRDELLSFTL